MDLKKKLADHRAKKAASSPGSKRVDSIADLIGIGSEENVDKLVEQAKSEGRFISLPAGRFVPDPTQPRKTFVKESIDELRASIESVGQIQPIVVRPVNDDGDYIIIAGERRWKAVSDSKVVNNLDAVIVSNQLDELVILRIQIHENDKRENISALESAGAIMRGVDICKSQGENIDDKKAAVMLGVSASSISKSRSIVNAPSEIKALSADNILQDSDALYELSKAHKKDPGLTKAFLKNIHSNAVIGNVRKAAQNLNADIKVKQSNSAATPTKSKGATPPKPKTKISSFDEKGSLLVVDGLDFVNDDGKSLVKITVSGEESIYLLSDSVVKGISNKYSIKIGN